MPRDILYLERIVSILEGLPESSRGIIHDYKEAKIDDELMEQYCWDYQWIIGWASSECDQGHSGPAAAVLYDRMVEATFALEAMRDELEQTFGPL